LRSVVKSSEYKSIDYKILKRLLVFLKPYSWLVIVSLAVSLITSALGPLRPYLTKLAVDNYIAKNDVHGLFYIILVIFGVLILHAALQFFITYVMQWVGQKVLFDIRDKVFSHIQSLSLKYFDKHPIGSLVTRVTNDIEALNQLFSSGVVNIIADFLLIFWLLGFMFYTNWQLALITLAVVPFLALTTVLFRKKIRDVFREIRAKVSEMNSFLNEFISGIAVVKIFAKEESQAEKFDTINEKHKMLWEKSIFYYAIFFPIIELLSSVSLALILWYTASSYFSGGITIGLLIAFTQYSEMFFRPIRDLTEKYTTMQSAMAASERIFDTLDTKEMIEYKDNGNIYKGLQNSIEFKDVSFSYDGEKPVLQIVNFEVKKGETVAIVGATGAGKTSIINLLLRFYEFNEGSILFDGKDIRSFDIDSLHNNIAIVTQEVFLFSRSIKENITLGSDYDDEQIIGTAEELGASLFIEKLPESYDTILNERGSTLSAGQRQLLAFCRAYITKPDILILDEATSNIDSVTEQIIEKALDKLLQGRTSIVIAHRLSTIKRADKIIVLHRGKVRETGTHAELLEINGLYRKLYLM
jgi:ATP-binding cassette, subfamily B, multidrug efflux pump